MRCIVLSLAAAALVAPQGAVAVWPQPASFTPGSGGPTLAGKFGILVGTAHPELTTAIRRAQDLSMWHGTPPSLPSQTSGILASLVITVAEQGSAFQLNTTAEAYNLTVPDLAAGVVGNATLAANTWLGAVRGLETFTQLISYDFSTEQYTVQPAKIEDVPLYAYRGMLVDTSRHFIGKADILRIIDAMAYAKMNVFLWHLVDDQSFPWVPTSRPEMGLKGAYPPAQTHTYTTGDIADVYSFAMARGVMIQVELDTPRHCLSWGKAYPDTLICGNTSGVGLINPASDITWEVQADLFAELRDAMPGSSVLHLGGDEVETTCWRDSAQVEAWAVQRGLTPAGWDAGSVQCGYHRQQAAMARKLGFIPFVWDDARMCELGNVTTAPGGAAGSAIIDVWSQDSQATAEVVGLGYRTVVSSMCEYLNHSNTDWETNWLCDPRNISATPEQLQLIIGAHVSRWGEFTDGTDFFANTFPGAYGMAEKLWSPAEVTLPSKIHDAESRLMGFRCIVVRRGIPVSPLAPGYCPEEFPSTYTPPGGM